LSIVRLSNNQNNQWSQNTAVQAYKIQRSRRTKYSGPGVQNTAVQAYKIQRSKTDVRAWHGIHLSHNKNQWNILVIGNYVNYQNYQNLMLLTSWHTKRTRMHLFLFTNSAKRELVSICTQYAEYTQPQLTFLASHPCV